MTLRDFANLMNRKHTVYLKDKDGVTICECKSDSVVIDKFGEGIQVGSFDNEHFTAEVQVQPSQTFFGWVFTFRGDIEILRPDSVKEEYLSIARKVAGIE